MRPTVKSLRLREDCKRDPRSFDGRTLQSVAEEYGLCRQLARYILTQHDVQYKRQPTRKKQYSQKLRQAIEEDREQFKDMFLHEIASKFYVGYVTAQQILREYNVSYRQMYGDYSEVVARGLRMRDDMSNCPEKFHDMRIKDVAKEYGVSYSTAQHALKEIIPDRREYVVQKFIDSEEGLAKARRALQLICDSIRATGFYALASTVAKAGLTIGLWQEFRNCYHDEIEERIEQAFDEYEEETFGGGKDENDGLSDLDYGFGITLGGEYGERYRTILAYKNETNGRSRDWSDVFGFKTGKTVMRDEERPLTHSRYNTAHEYMIF